MNTPPRERSRLARYAYLGGCRCIIIALVVMSGLYAHPGWAGVDLQTEGAPLGVEDGGKLEIAEDAILLYEAAGDGQEPRVRWSVPAEKAYHSLFFETPAKWHQKCSLL